MKKLGLAFALAISFCSFSQEKHTINGYVKDSQDGESLIGATVFVKEITGGNTTNVYGFYSITLEPGTYTVEFRYLGYRTQVRTITLSGDERIDIELQSDDVELEEVVVTAEPEDQNVTSTEMSVAKLDIKTITKMPAFFGEVDIIKSLQLLPGVSTVGEGASGYNVRGGNVGQNLILLDEAPVYNSSHLFGFFSVFNPDAVKDVKLYKGGIPAQYGGRISSVLDIRMKEGNTKNFDYTGGIGTVFGRFAVEGPIVQDKSSFILAGRRSWIDAFLKPAGVLESDDAIYFYDLTMKTNYTFNDKNRLFLSGYWGRDVFTFQGQGFNWGNRTGTLRWNHLVNDRLFTNFSLIYSEYDYALNFGDDPDNSFDWDSQIRTFDFKPQASYFINTNNELNFGGQFTYYTFEPANAVGVSEGTVIDFSVPEKYASEWAIYLNNEQKISSKLKLNYGIRLSAFNYLGPADVFALEQTEPGRQKEITDIQSYSRGETIESFINPEPRVSMNYQINETSSLKASYNRMVQYIHLISVSTASTPLDIWTPSTNNVRPEKGHLYSLGYFRNLENNNYELSAELYYRTIEDQLDYRNGLSINDLLINEYVERDLLSAESRAYGLELYAKKNKGRLNGWISYTLSRAEMRADGISNGDWYSANYDQPHNFKVASFYDLSQKIQFSANFTYNTGRPFTAMDQTYEVGGYTVYHSSNGDRNSKRIGDYHRLDVSFTFDLRKRTLFKRDYTSSLVVSVYNLYGRKNAFSNFINQGEVDFGEASDPGYTRFSMIGFVLPSVTYNFNF